MMQITEWGKRRIESADFKKTLAWAAKQSIKEGASADETINRLCLYAAINLVAENGRFSNGPELVDFLNANDDMLHQIVRGALHEIVGKDIPVH